MPASFADILLAFDFVSSGGAGENEAFVCKQSGKIYWRSEITGTVEEIPEDIDEEDMYVPIPHKKELDLAQPLIFKFVRQFLPDETDNVREFFSRRGAYARFKDMLKRRDAIDQWHDFEEKAVEMALRDWCKDNSIEVGD